MTNREPWRVSTKNGLDSGRCNPEPNSATTKSSPPLKVGDKIKRDAIK